ncbi:hypothetical protein RDWZM_010398 [Blomia tropicalis]|uniref:Uncharacterized protein n=1 Tax=Blomia tropicalis TaxID=40697 RepID=A0A9Q0LWN7_BLOTA|nr:hypothetical protein BLOT_010349 [Blomia tropicalis]KAJ6215898.1 hypothetical protein RDWZM_010398 [Blomia tropicalis]
MGRQIENGVEESTSSCASSFTARAGSTTNIPDEFDDQREMLLVYWGNSPLNQALCESENQFEYQTNYRYHYDLETVDLDHLERNFSDVRHLEISLTEINGENIVKLLDLLVHFSDVLSIDCYLLNELSGVHQCEERFMDAILRTHAFDINRITPNGRTNLRGQ